MNSCLLFRNKKTTTNAIYSSYDYNFGLFGAGLPRWGLTYCCCLVITTCVRACVRVCVNVYDKMYQCKGHTVTGCATDQHHQYMQQCVQAKAYTVTIHSVAKAT